MHVDLRGGVYIVDRCSVVAIEHGRSEAVPAFQKWPGHCNKRSLVHVHRRGGEGERDV